MGNLSDKTINEVYFIYAILPETNETINIFDKEFYNKMSKEAVFMNFRRGNAVVEDDIVEILENNLIRGTVLDVAPSKPLNKDSKLYNISSRKIITYKSLSFIC